MPYASVVCASQTGKSVCDFRTCDGMDLQSNTICGTHMECVSETHVNVEYLEYDVTNMKGFGVFLTVYHIMSWIFMKCKALRCPALSMHVPMHIYQGSIYTYLCIYKFETFAICTFGFAWNIPLCWLMRTGDCGINGLWRQEHWM